MKQEQINQLLLKNFPFEPTTGQANLLLQLSGFLAERDNRKVFMMKGYAGTGKTSIIITIVNTLPEAEMRTILLAPTGRAAKVLNNYTNREASTIHRKIYQIKTSKKGDFSILMKENKHTNTLFIVDEASMISTLDNDGAATLFGERNLLSDLFEFVKSGKNCFLMFVGDTAQLPPVKQTVSPGLDADYLQRNFDVEIIQNELKEVVRQQQASGILLNATALRILINRNATHPVMKEVGFDDVHLLASNEVEEALQQAYSNSSVDETLILCRSNKQANRYNQMIRQHILDYSDELNAGDEMMVLKNNYFWLEDGEGPGFIANGDVIRILRVSKYEEAFGFRFANASVELVDTEVPYQFETKLLLDTIYADTPALSNDSSRNFYNEVMLTKRGKTKAKRIEEVRQDPFFNALQVKFSYAVTCHKAQGGQWKNIFIDQGWMPDDAYNTEHLRWLYTAVTRAVEKLYLINFDEKFFKK